MKSDKILVEFTLDHLLDRNLVIQLLKREDELFQSQDGQNIYKSMPDALSSSEPQLVIQRKVLIEFGFISSKYSIQNYHRILEHYYKGPTDYDKDVMNAVAHFRENKILYYQKPLLVKGDDIPDVPLQHVSSSVLPATATTTSTSLHKVIDQIHRDNESKITPKGSFICAFSGS
jgi:hypothetical protein